MKLTVIVNEGRNLPAMDLNGLSDPYVKLQLGRHKFKSKVVKKSLNPSWGEEFTFKVEDMEEALILTVMDEDRCFNDDFIGHVKIPVSRVFDAPNKSLGSSWYPLQPKTTKRAKSKCAGEISLTVTFHGVDWPSTASDNIPLSKTEDATSLSPTRMSLSASPSSEELPSARDDKVQKSLADRFAQIFNKNSDTSSNKTHSPAPEHPDILPPAEATDLTSKDDGNFDEILKFLEMSDSSNEIPSNLAGGTLLDQSYAISPRELNSLLFSPESSFPKSLAEVQGNSDQQFGSWKLENGPHSMKRVVTYVKAPTKLIKAVKATEEQTYLKANENTFVVLSSVSTPEVMYGSTFKTEILYHISPGPEVLTPEQTSRLVISWQMNFLQSTIMKGMIESGARQGLKESFDQFSSLLSKTINTVDSESQINSDLSSMQAEPQSDWKLAAQYLGNFTVFSTVLSLVYVLVHIWLSAPSSIHGLEFLGLDLPDSFGELVVCGVLVLQSERLLKMLSRFMQAKMHQKSDHGVKAQGDGWLLTVALIEGANLAAVDASGYCDPYVVFSCNGKSRTSSIKFQKPSPLWNEIFEFDAMDEPPSVLNVEVFDFDGPFDEATSLGHGEINFVKSSSDDLADMWIPLQGKLAQACNSKLRLRIFLNNSRGNNVVKDYITRMEKEVGKKINVRSPQKNSAFQKLFGLSSEEFLINDFTCHLKRKMPLQGRLFLSARIIGFHANLFGHKTKFSFLWEDIEGIEINPPTLSSMGSPIIVVTMRKGKGMDARHGARGQDDMGRLKFKFHSFVSFGVAHRTIMALWKARSLSPEQKVKLVEEESESRILETEEGGSFLGVDEVTMTEVYSSTLSVPAKVVMELYGGELDRKIMEKVGCVTYSYTPWESEKPEVYERQLHYRLDKRVSGYRGEVTSTQQKRPLPDSKGWVVEEVMNLHGVPLGDYFNLHLRYQIEDAPSNQRACQVVVWFGVAWLKGSRHEKRMNNNIVSNLQERLTFMFAAVEKEYASRYRTHISPFP